MGITEAFQAISDDRNNLLKEVAALRAELAAEREKVEELLSWVKSNSYEYRYCKYVNQARLEAKISELWPDPNPAPEPKMWDWAIKELMAGRKVRWVAWAETSHLYMVGDSIRCSWNSLGWTPLGCNFTTPGWLPYEEEE